MSQRGLGGWPSPIFQSGAALTAQLPDSTIAGGNARGAGAVDLQTERTAVATRVASGVNSTLSGGVSNTASGLGSTISGGLSNVASAIRSTVSGGQSNSASGGQSSIGGGISNVADGALSWIPGGQFASTRGVSGRGAWSAGQIASQGDTQSGEHSLARQTTDATATRLTSDNAAPSALNQIILPNFASYSGPLTVTAKGAGGTAAASWTINVAAVRGNGVGTVVVYQGGGAALVPTASNGVGSAWRLAVDADLTHGGIAVTGTGAAATTINWAVRYANVEAVTAS